jgi:hypothetical protein
MMKILRSNDDYEFLLGDDATDLFYYYDVKELHGLNLTDCMNLIKEGGTYIDGMCNLIPHDYSRFYIFINMSSLNGSYKDVTLVQHETTHGGFIKYDYQIDKEEEIITWGEELTNEIMPQIFREINIKRYNGN